MTHFSFDICFFLLKYSVSAVEIAEMMINITMCTIPENAYAYPSSRCILSVDTTSIVAAFKKLYSLANNRTSGNIQINTVLKCSFNPFFAFNHESEFRAVSLTPSNPILHLTLDTFQLHLMQYP